MPDFVVFPVEDALCLRMGRIITRWTVVEKLTSLLLGTLLFADQGAMSVVTSSVSLSTQSKWICTLIKSHEHEAEQSKPVLELLLRAEDLRNERNELAHGTWDPSDSEAGTSIVETVNLDRTEIIRCRLVTTHDLDDLLDDIDRWISDYAELGRKLGFPRQRGEIKSLFVS